MNNRETAQQIRKHFEGNWQGHPFSWPTDPCGYDQHIKFVDHRNKNWDGETPEQFKEFCFAYADALEKTK